MYNGRLVFSNPTVVGKVVAVIIERFSRGGNVVSASLVAVLMVMISADTITRYVVSRQLPMAFELSEEFLVAIGFLGSAYTLAQEGHVSIDLLVKRLSSRARAATNVFNYGVALALFSALGWTTSVMVRTMYQEKAMTDVIHGMPTWATYIAIPIGSFLLCFQLLLKLFRACRLLAGKDKIGEEPVK